MITGADDVIRRFRGLADRVPENVQNRVGDLAEEVLERAREAAPIQTGQLRGSAFLKRTPEGVEIGFSAPHALTVHERTDVPHRTGEAKFLERPLYAAEPELTDAVVESVVREL